jgi:hypothetical protein
VTDQTQDKPAPRSSAQRILGGQPVGVIVRLVLLSIVVGVVLDVLGFDPFNIIDSLQRLVRQVWAMGFDAVTWLWRYLVLGAAVVVPIWIVVRLINMAQGR